MIKYVIISIKNNLSNLLNPQHENKENKKNRGKGHFIFGSRTNRFKKRKLSKPTRKTNQIHDHEPKIQYFCYLNNHRSFTMSLYLIF